MSGFLLQAESALQAGNIALGYQLLVSAIMAGESASDVWYQYGALAEQLRRWSAAAASFERVLRERPDDVVALTARGWNLHLAGRTIEAERFLRKAIVIRPEFGLAHTNLSHVLCTLGRDDESLVEARLGVDFDPGSALAHLALGFALFFNGRWEEGFREYEARIPLKLADMGGYPYPRWRGERTGTLFLLREQGLGDSIQMLRYVDAACERADRVILHVQRELVSLCRDRWPEVRVVGMPTPLPSGVDAWCPLMALPALLWRETERYRYLGDYRRQAERPKKIGLAWAGDPTHDNDQHRSMALADLLPLVEVPGVEFVSLQVGRRGTAEMDAVGAHGLIEDKSPELFDVRDTARVIEELDLVISVDTAVAHLAGAMGCPTWVLINQRGCDWRWRHEREDTIWYPGVRLFRRALDEQWANVVMRVRDALS